MIGRGPVRVTKSQATHVSGPAGLPSIADAPVHATPESGGSFPSHADTPMLGTLHSQCVDCNGTCSGAKRERGRAPAGLPMAGAAV